MSLSDLLIEINGTSSAPKGKSRGWPEHPRSMRSALERIAPNLRGIGIEVLFDVRRTGEARLTGFDLKAWTPPA